MSYPIETKLAPKTSWFTPVEAKNYYGRYSRDGITVHWWGGGEPASAHDSIVNYFLQQGAAGVKSVNYVVSDIKITKMVEPDNVAWASQSGNPVSVSIEFQPTLSAEGYKRGGWLINELEKKYGKTLTLWPHNHWFSTSCPGTLDLNRLRSEANKIKENDNMVAFNKGDRYNFLNETLGKKYADLAATNNYWHEFIDKPTERGTSIFGIIRSTKYKAWAAEVKAVPTKENVQAYIQAKLT